MRSVFVTPHTQEHDELVDELVAALAALGVTASYVDDALVVDGARLPVGMVHRAHPTPADLAQLVADAPADVPAVVVADRVSEPGRAVLRKAGWGWLDRRGHVRIWAPGVRIESPVDGQGGGPHRGGNPWTTVGLETVLAVLVEPDLPATARRVAPLIGRSVGTVHEVIARLASEGLVGRTTHLPLLPELFWEAAAHWPDGGWAALDVDLATVAERAGPGAVVRVDERAATLGGARIAAAGSFPVRAYIVGDSAFRKARSLAGGDGPTACLVRQAPVRWFPLNTDYPPDDERPWRVGHPLVCALRLAADPARGREIVESWGIVPGGDR